MNLKKLTLCSVAAGAAFFAALAPSEVMAANIIPTSYDMPNGDGIDNGGTFN